MFDTFKTQICHTVEAQIRTHLPNNNGKAKTWNNLNTLTETELLIANMMANVANIEIQDGESTVST